MLGNCEWKGCRKSFIHKNVKFNKTNLKQMDELDKEWVQLPVDLCV